MQVTSNHNEHSPRIKICGIRDQKTALAAIAAGADYIGFMFYRKSIRAITPDEAKPIVAAIKQHGAVPVGVFVDEDAAVITQVCTELSLGIVQLHGDVARNSVDQLQDHIQCIYVLPVLPGGEVMDTVSLAHNLHPERDFILYDGVNPGSGEAFSWDNFHLPHPQYRFFLAGGLTPDNVNEAIDKVNPFALDVSSGVESERGIKDIKLIEQFINHARGEYEH